MYMHIQEHKLGVAYIIIRRYSRVSSSRLQSMYNLIFPIMYVFSAHCHVPHAGNMTVQKLRGLAQRLFKVDSFEQTIHYFSKKVSSHTLHMQQEASCSVYRTSWSLALSLISNCLQALCIYAYICIYVYNYIDIVMDHPSQANNVVQASADIDFP